MFYYKTDRPTNENLVFKTIGCIWVGMMKKIKGQHSSWIRGAIGRYSELFVDDVCAVLNILKLFIPLPIYFALLNQMDSTWTFQSTQLDTNIMGIKIEPDQVYIIILIRFQ